MTHDAEQRDIDFARASLPKVGAITEMLKTSARVISSRMSTMCASVGKKRRYRSACAS